MERYRLKEYLKADLYRYGGLRTSCYFLKALLPPMPSFRFTYFLRYASVYSKYSIIGFLCRVLLQHYSYKYGYQIPPNTKIGKGLYIVHLGPVVINGKAEIGKNCTLSHIVNIGQTNRGKRAGCPIIGNDVFIGTGAVIVGKIIIGDNVLIAPNSLVNFDVPSNSIVFGNPAVVEARSNATEGYVNFLLDSQ
jgi:serine O-acetyltransferase